MGYLNDDPHRELTPDELRGLDVVANALRWWRIYLESEDGTPSPLYEEALKYRCPVFTRHKVAQGAKPPECPPMVVNSLWCAQWCRDNAVHRPGWIVPTQGELELALEWLNIDRATTFYPAAQMRPTPRRLSDPVWWRCDAPRALRLVRHLRTPVLTPYPGRRRHTEPTAVPRRARIVMATPGLDEVVALLHQYLVEYRPTALAGLVARDHRPLCVRSKSRPTRYDTFRAYRTDVLLVSDDAFAFYVNDTAGRRGAGLVDAATLGEVTATLRDSDRYPALTGQTNVRAADLCGGAVSGARWTRVELAPMGVTRIDWADAAAEAEAFQMFDADMRARHGQRAMPSDNFLFHYEASLAAAR